MNLWLKLKLFSKHQNNKTKDYRANGVLLNWSENVTGVTGKHLPNNPQKIIPSLKHGEKMRLVLDHYDIKVVTSNNQPIGFLRSRPKPLLEKLISKEQIDTVIDDTGTVWSDNLSKNVWWCSIEITLYANDNDILAKQQGHQSADMSVGGDELFFDSLGQYCEDRWSFRVAGTTFAHGKSNPQRIIPLLFHGEKVKLIPDPKNEHDNAAIKVLTLDDRQIGWYPSTAAYSGDLFNRLMANEEINVWISDTWHSWDKNIWGCEVSVITYRQGEDNRPEKQSCLVRIQKQKEMDDDRAFYEELFKKLPDITPKSFSAFRRIKNLNSERYKTLIVEAQKNGLY